MDCTPPHLHTAMMSAPVYPPAVKRARRETSTSSGDTGVCRRCTRKMAALHEMHTIQVGKIERSRNQGGQGSRRDLDLNDHL